MDKKSAKRCLKFVLPLLLLLVFAVPVFGKSVDPTASALDIKLKDISAYDDVPYVDINDGEPGFTDSELESVSNDTEYYSSLDSKGRCGVAYAVIGTESMPTEERGKIGEIKPTGWHTVKYDCVSGKYLYNRCHLIGYQLAGENANEKNLITGTRYLNVDGMLPWEDAVADYCEQTGNHVLYRVTPLFKDNNLLASGVLMEAESIEDKGDDLKFCIYCYNVQPCVEIDYKTGESTWNGEYPDFESEATATKPKETATPTPTPETTPEESQSTGINYVVNTNTGKFHYPTCRSVKQMSDKNKMEFSGSRDELIGMGYSPCQNCNP